jgi:hypothetical protein
MQNPTTESSSAMSPEETSTVNPDARDVRDQLLSETGQESSQGEDGTTYGAAKQGQTEEVEIRLKALEETQKVLISKFATTTATLNAINTTIENLRMDVEDNRESFELSLRAIRVTMEGMRLSLAEVRNRR